MLAGSPPPLRTPRPSVPPAIEAAVMQALERVPADRFATAADLLRRSPAATWRPCAPRRRLRHARVRAPGPWQRSPSPGCSVLARWATDLPQAPLATSGWYAPRSSSVTASPSGRSPTPGLPSLRRAAELPSSAARATMRPCGCATWISRSAAGFRIPVERLPRSSLPTANPSASSPGAACFPSRSCRRRAVPSALSCGTQLRDLVPTGATTAGSIFRMSLGPGPCVLGRRCGHRPHPP